MSQKTYLTILRWGSYLTLLSVILTFKNLLFPYVTSKQIYFNIVIEILLVFWLAFIIKYPSYSPFGTTPRDYARGKQDRPKKSWISIGLVSFFAIIFLSCFTGVDFNLSFWGDIERMLGVFHLLHFLGFYFILITVMRKWENWRNLFIVSIGFAVWVSFYGILQKLEIIYSPWGSNRIISTIGNAAYVGAYAVFNFYFAIILFFKEKNSWIRFGYAIAAFLILLTLIFSGTRGAYLGFGISILVALLVSAILNKNKKIRKYSLSIFAVLAILVLIVFTNTDKAFVENSSFLSRMTHISLKDATMQTRLISWKAAAKDFKEHPILGTGHGNFAITFDKYFEPTFYNYTRSETYFDRAHNNFIDIASTTGLLGILTYFSIFIAVGFYLLRGFIKKKISLVDFSLISSLIIAYFIQNLVVFDALVTYICLMITLGYIYYLNQKNDEDDPSASSPQQNSGQARQAKEEADKKLVNKEIYVLAILGIIMSIVIWQFNVKPLKMLYYTIAGQMSFAQEDIVSVYANYQKALSYETILDRDSRDTFIKSLNSRMMAISKMDDNKVEEILDYAIDLARKNTQYNPEDSLMQTSLATILDNAARYWAPKNPEKLHYYTDQALEAINKAISSSPGRIPLYFEKAQIQLTKGESGDSINTMKYAISLNADYYESSCQLSKIYFIVNRSEDAFKEMDICLEKGQGAALGSIGFIQDLIEYYASVNKLDNLLILYKKLASMDKNNISVWINLAKLYAQTGENELAKEAALKTVDLDPSNKTAVEQFIRSLE